MEEKDKIKDLPSYSKAREELRGLDAIGKIVKVFSFFGIKKGSLNEAVDQMHDIKKDLELIHTLPDRYNAHFAQLGWIAHESMSVIVMEKAVELADANRVCDAENILSKHFTSKEVNWLQQRFKSLPAFSIRFELIEKAYQETLEKRYHSCVLLLLTIIDGVVNDISKSKGFFSMNTELKAWNSIAAHSSGLTTVRDIFNATRRKTNPDEIYLPYRNGILHGRDLKFDNQHVAGKCWSTLFAVYDWARALHDEKVNKPVPVNKMSAVESVKESIMTVINYQQFKIKHDLKMEELNNWQPRKNININPSNFTKYSPEKAAFNIAENWRKKNYGNIARLIHRFSDKEINIGVEAGRIRRELEHKKLLSFQIKFIKDETPAISEVTMDICYEMYERNRSKEIVIRLIRQEHDEKVKINEKYVYWKFINNFFYLLDL